MPDPAMINAYLQRRGAPTSAANGNRVREHFAANPDQLDRAAMGLPPGLEDRVPPTLDMMLDKVIADTGMPTNASMPEANGTAGDRAPAPAPSRRGPTTNTQTYSPNEASGSPLQRGGIPGDANAPQGPGSVMSGMVNEQGMPVAADAPATDTGILKWLLPILGISAAVPAAENMRSGPMSLAPPGSPLALEDQDYGRVQGRRATEYPSGAPVITDHTMKNVQGTAEMYSDAPYARQGQRNQMQTEIDAENDTMMRQMLEQERARKAQRSTKELGDAAKRATGRR